MASEFKKFVDKPLQLNIKDDIDEINRVKKHLDHLKLPNNNSTTNMQNTILFGIYLEFRKFNKILNLK